MAQRILLYDKSALEAIPVEDAIHLASKYYPVLAPTLVYEVLADLTKVRKRGSPAQHVSALACRLGGGGPPVNIDYRRLCLTELATGKPVPMSQQIIPDGQSSDGRIIEVTEFNEAILRWSRGVFTPADCDLALRWRECTRHLSLLAFHREIRSRRIQLRRPSSDDDLVTVMTDVLSDRAQHGAWLSYLTTQLGAGPLVAASIRRRWSEHPSADLAKFAPYSWFCLRALLAVLILWAHGQTKREANNLIDVQYLYYLPFCHVFASRDSLHRRLAPVFMQPGQSFLWGDDLRAELADRAARARAAAR